MEFRLVYKGLLPSQKSGGGGARNQEKHQIRLAMHEQLKLLWREHPLLKGWFNRVSLDRDARTHIDELGDKFQKCKFRFLPLVNNVSGLACSLDILFLRRDPPGTPIISGGDMDNRLKVLLDGLKMPRECGQIPSKWKQDPTHDPLFCLMEDDNLITEIKVTSDRLLVPLGKDEHRHEVELVIHVTTKILKPYMLSIDGVPQV